jgi:hypothetical protein
VEGVTKCCDDLLGERRKNTYILYGKIPKGKLIVSFSEIFFIFSNFKNLRLKV